jgi:putative glycosyltransferase
MTVRASPGTTSLDLSVVTTLYRSARFIREFYDRTVTVATSVAQDFEIIFVNDGSPDDSLAIALAIADHDPRVRVVDLSRNFGHHAAVMAGLSYAQGARVFLIDVDLEERPEWLEPFWRQLEHTGADVVYGSIETRGGGLFKRYSGSLFYKVFNVVSDTPIPNNACTVRLMRREYCEAIVGLRESGIFLAGLFAWTGFRQIPLAVSKPVRADASTYSLVRLIALFVNAITSFSSYPLRLMFFLGVLLTVLSLSIGTYFVIRKFLDPSRVLIGWASVMVSIWFFGGLIISFLGIMGLYLSGIYMEAKQRPRFIVRQTYGQNQLEGAVRASASTTERIN